MCNVILAMTNPTSHKQRLIGTLRAMEIISMSDFLLKLILRYPDLFDETDVPCPLREHWRMALEDQQAA